MILLVILIAGCSGTTPLTWVCPDGTEVIGGPDRCPEALQNQSTPVNVPTESIQINNEVIQFSCKGTARCFSGTVTKVTDGDTLRVDNISIRLTLVDAPESYESGYSEAANFALTICPIGSTAIVDEDDGQTAGSYGRIVAVVYCKGTNLNAVLLSNGKATLYKEFCNVSEFADEEWTGC
jgi:endonuclease YncB( thermonuclease family)